MDVTPTRPALFVLSDEDRDVEPGGPALTDALSMPRKELRVLASRGEIPFRSSEYVDWVLLSDVIMLSRRLDGDREEMLQSFADEPPPTL
jgi:hypothetical protein